ncbi:GNAT superfamily N-acetyltransferase [Aeromicrobium panaciterrae]|uniref:GNAT superfamily N-acetyltransferase n=1 Tax=Aeromicrobium panaciterrae TaxID=363861 RepID=A0ABU1UKT6_9ACTN|nr:GNAT family N-acetyltransferase [Aeromicrobium panaciterrae]MDR7085792.1 GNAT superfamily N-acetyltransferase [Aeromicrobium panaciterrae]
MSDAVSLDLVDPGSAEAREAVAAYLLELDQRFEEGFDPSEAAGDEEKFGGDHGVFLVAILDGKVVGCGGLTTIGEGVAEIKRMWVAKDARGRGLAGRIRRRLEELAVELGHDVVRLDTNRALTNAIEMYRAAGYADIERYNDNPYADFWFEKRLTS